MHPQAQTRLKRVGIYLCLILTLFGFLWVINPGDGRAHTAVQYLDNIGPKGMLWVDCSYTREEILDGIEAHLARLKK